MNFKAIIIVSIMVTLGIVVFLSVSPPRGDTSRGVADASPSEAAAFASAVDTAATAATAADSAVAADSAADSATSAAADSALPAERLPLLLLPYRDADDVARAAYIFADGSIFLAPRDATAVSVPTLRELHYDTIAPGARIPNAYMGILDSLAMVRERLPEVYAHLTDVVIINKERADYEIALYLDFATVPLVSNVPISMSNLETALIVVSNLSGIDQEAGVTHISIRGARAVIRYEL